MWAIVLGATALVVALAVFKGRKGVGALEGKPAPPLTLQLLDGDKKVELSSRRGRVVMLDFWATWCGPCRATMPRVEKIFREYEARGVDAYAVNTDVSSPNREPTVREFMLQNSLNLTVAIDGDEGAAQSAFGVSSLPTLVVLDRKGAVAFSHVGTMNSSVEQELRSTIDAALKAREAKSN